MRRLLLLAALLATSAPAHTQVQATGTKLSGPRFGLTVITGSNADRVRDELGIQPVISQFGWQFETQMFRSSEQGGVTAVSELVALAGGLEQGQFLPSLTGLVGLRTSTGTEIGVGPNVSLAGVGLAVAGGVTFSMGDLHLPLNVAVVPSSGGMRFSFLGGFTIRDAQTYMLSR
jgi:hypothetical protein